MASCGISPAIPASQGPLSRLHLWRDLFRRISQQRYLVPLLYLTVALPTVLFLCFLMPPMQSPDEGRHFLRACQIAQGQFLSQIDARTGDAGGVLPSAESEFVRDKMRTDFLRAQDRLRTVSERLAALDLSAQRQSPLSERRFTSFPGTAVYPPVLYLPQAIGIRLARLFSSKVYVLFYSARVLNALVAIALVFLALYLAPSHQYLLFVPAVLPMSLYQFSSVSSDAAIIAVCALFVALCIRFVDDDGKVLRLGLILSLLLLTLGKPVHLPAALLLLAAHKRLGWRRTLLFFLPVVAVCGTAYVVWARMASAFFSKAGADSPDRNPAMQIHLLGEHPLALLNVLLATLKHQGWSITGEVIGFFGWLALSLPTWFYEISFAIGAAMVGCLLVNAKAMQRVSFIWGALAAFGTVLAVCLGAYILWTPPGSPEVIGIQGRYLIPAFILLLFMAPPLSALSTSSRVFVYALTIGFFLLSAFWTVRIVDHYYFPRSELIGDNVFKLYKPSAQSCPASIGSLTLSWFSAVETGQAMAHDPAYRIVLAEDDGTIVGESDPVLIGGGPTQWRANMWNPDSAERIDSWLILGNSACRFGHVELRPRPIPSV